MEKNLLGRVLSAVTSCLITLFGSGLILFTKEVSAAASAGIDACMRVVIPSLFPFFVLSSLCISTGMAHSLSRLFALPMRYLFRLPSSCAPAFVLGLIGGYPIGAKTAFDLYDGGACTAEECSRLLGFCSSCGPAFIFSAVGVSLFGSLRAGAVIYICHILSAVIIGVLSGFFYRGGIPQKSVAAHRGRLTPSAFTSAVSSSFASMINVCGFVIFFSALMAFLQKCGFFSLCQRLLFFLPQGYAESLTKGIIEMTGGVLSLPCQGASLPFAMAVCAFIIGFGGLSVHCQVLSLLGDRPIYMGRYFIGKAAQGILSAALVYPASVYFLREVAVSMPPVESERLYAASPLYYFIVMGVYLSLALLLSSLMSKEKRVKKTVAKKASE